MKEAELIQLEKEGKAKEVIPQGITIEELSARVDRIITRLSSSQFDKNDMQYFLQSLRAIKRPITSVPTNVPKNFLQQIEFYDDGTEKRLYLYIANSWTMISTNRALVDAVYMLVATASDIGGVYKQLVDLDIYTAGSLSTITTSVTTTATLMTTFATNSGYPNIVTIPAGLITCHYETQKASGSNNYYTYFEIYKRTSGGTETLLATSDTTTELATNRVIQHNPSAFLLTPATLNATDRLVVKFYGVMLSASANIDFLYDDNSVARLEFKHYEYS